MAAVLAKARSRRAEHELPALFQRTVAPHLADLEQRRQHYRRRSFVILGGVLAGIFLTFLLVQQLQYALFATVVVLAVGFILLQRTQRSYADQVRKAVMPAVCEAIGDISHGTGRAPDLDLQDLEQIGLLPSHNRRSIDDVFQGHHRQTGFTMAEVRLRRVSRFGRRRRRTVFRGLIFAIDVPRAVPGRILIAKDGGLIGNHLKGWIKSFGGMQAVPLPHGGFEACFELYADRPDLAREIVTPSLCDDLVALAEAHDGAPFQAAFTGRRFFLALRKRGDRFRIGSLFRSTEELDEEALRLLRDVQFVHRLIDYLHGDRPPLQPDAGATPGPVERC